jgi:phosphate-selective porin OprO and OprP
MAVKFKVRGRIHTDANFVNQDTAITDERDVDATRIRRARLGVQGTVFNDIDYLLEVDFADNRVSLADQCHRASRFEASPIADPRRLTN